MDELKLFSFVPWLTRGSTTQGHQLVTLFAFSVAD
jgi:hypothetical protein